MLKRRLTPQEIQARRVQMVQDIQMKKINEKKVWSTTSQLTSNFLSLGAS